jgi:erythrocyte band 7 integral membrane protein
MPKRPNGPTTDKIVNVQPLKRSEMQPSYGQDLGTGEVEHGIYGSLLNVLGDCVGLIGAIPCCPLPNPYRNVQQGRFPTHPCSNASKPSEPTFFAL